MKIAVIIPAFKPEHLDAAIRSIVEQTNQNFHLYVGDDAGPKEIFEICQNYTHLENFTYARFNTNVGKNNLIASWERCISLCNNEDYIWVFSDDDLAECSCIEAAINCITEDEQYPSIINLNTRVINNSGKVTSKDPTLPKSETSLDLAKRILEGRMLICMQSQIFSKEAHKKMGGIVNFPFGQASDWATAIHFASINDIKHLSNTYVYWRNSGSNITAIAHKHNTLLKINAHLKFHSWICTKFKNIDDIVFQRLILENLRSVFLFHYRCLPIRAWPNLVRSLKHSNSKNSIYSFFFILEIRVKLLKLKIRSKSKIPS